MFKRIAALCAAALMFMAVMPAQAQSRSIFWERWDVIIDNVDTTDNRFDVSEQYVIRFNGTFTFGSAVIPYTNLEDIQNVRVYQDGELLRSNCAGGRGTFCARREGDEMSIVYYFLEPVTDGQRSFTISYTVVGALRIYDGGDQLAWDAIPAEHYGFSIGNASVKIQLPPDAAPREGIDPVETYGVPTDVRVNGSNIQITATERLEGSDYLTVRLQYPHNPNARVPFWQASYDAQAAFDENVRPLIDVGAIALGMLIAIGIPLFVWTRYITKGRDPVVGIVPEFLSEPPSNLPPAMVGTLVDEHAHLRDVMSTLLDLGQRGYLVIQENQNEGFLGIGRSSSYIFKRTDKPIQNDPALRKFEQRLLSNLFPAQLMERSLDSLKEVFYSVIQMMQADLYEELVKEGLFARNPNATRTSWYGAAAGLGFLGIIGFFVVLAVLETATPSLLCIPVALLVGAVATAIAAPAMPAKTQKGAEEAAKWKGFVEYLRNLEKYGDVGTAAEKFSAYLPYAVAAGIDRNWVQRFARVPNVSIPPWYYPTYLGPYSGGYRAGTPLRRGIGIPSFDGGEGSGLPGELARADDGGLSLDNLSGGMAGALENISNGLTNMVESAGRIMTSTPAPKGGSSGSWSSGGRSFSGGGRSGGGFRSSGGGSRGFG